MKFSEKIETLIIEASYLNVSDIHFHPQKEKVKIYYRIIDKLKYQANISYEEYNQLLRYIKFKSKLDISISNYPQDGAFILEKRVGKRNYQIYIRISTIPLINSESLVIRLLQNQEELSFDKIAYKISDLEKMYRTLISKNGLFIFTGPTGSGKTTTMYNLLNKLVKEKQKKVITIENPIEIINEKFIQIQINEDLNITYPVCLKASLRQDPDLIMIGEIRDEQTARNVFRATLTGHTVISTMHTKNKTGVIDRFKDFGFLQSEIKSILIGISNQRLILDENNMIKAIYDFAVGHKLEKLLNGEIEDAEMEKFIQENYNSKISLKKN